MICCKYCCDCKQIGRMRDQGFSIGRKKYYCKHEGLKSMKDKHGFHLDGFIGFGTVSKESPIALKTSPRWCPRKIK